MFSKRLKKLFKRIKHDTITLVGIIVCTIGLSVQVFYLTYAYVQYHVAYDKRLDFAYELVVPDIVICIMPLFVVKFDLLFKENRKHFEHICQDEMSCLGNKKTYDQFTKRLYEIYDMDSIRPYLISFKDFLKKVEIGPDKLNRLADECVAFDHLMLPHYACFTITCRRNGTPIQVMRGHNGVNFFQQILTLNFNTGSWKKKYILKVIIQPPENSLSTPRDRGCMVTSSVKGFAKFQLKYRRVLIERLPSPYETNCRNFQADKTLDACLNKHMLEKFHSPCPGRFIHPLHYEGKKVNIPKASYEGSYRSLYRKCYIPLREECRTIRYSSTLQSDEFMEDESANGMIIEILSPVEHDTVVFAVAKITFYNFAIAITNLITAWFGISVLNAVFISLMFAKKHHLKEKQFFKKNSISTVKYLNRR